MSTVSNDLSKGVVYQNHQVNFLHFFRFIAKLNFWFLYGDWGSRQKDRSFTITKRYLEGFLGNVGSQYMVGTLECLAVGS